MDFILHLDRVLLIAVNGWNSPFMDRLMIFFSAIPVWIPLYIAIAVLFFFPRYWGKKSFIHRVGQEEVIPFWIAGLISIAAAGICFGLCDQISVIIKHGVERYRPSQEKDLYGIIRLITRPGSLYGFVSSHAANTFGLAVLASLIVRRKIFTVFILLWAMAVSYSRVYLAVHYPLDVICGAILGTVLALFTYRLWMMSIQEVNNYFQRKKCSVS